MTKTSETRPLTKSALIMALTGEKGLTKAQVASLLDALATVAAQELGKNGPGVLTLPGICKLKTVNKPAKPAREGKDPFTGQQRTFAAKPASRSVRITPLKSLKDSVAG